LSLYNAVLFKPDIDISRDDHTQQDDSGMARCPIYKRCGGSASGGLSVIIIAIESETGNVPSHNDDHSS
jgi:hypothetical protein